MNTQNLRASNSFARPLGILKLIAAFRHIFFKKSRTYGCGISLPAAYGIGSHFNFSGFKSQEGFQPGQSIILFKDHIFKTDFQQPFRFRSGFHKFPLVFPANGTHFPYIFHLWVLNIKIRQIIGNVAERIQSRGRVPSEYKLFRGTFSVSKGNRGWFPGIFQPLFSALLPSTLLR